MARRLTSDLSERPAPYPRPGRPILPRLLRPVLENRNAPFLWAADGSAQEWLWAPPETCRQLGMAVVDRAQTRLAGFPRALLAVHLPGPDVALSYGLERRTANTLRRALASGEVEGLWTLERYIALPRFGGRAVVDLLSAVEAHGGNMRRPTEVGKERRCLNALAEIARRLPISAARARAELLGGPELDRPFDLGDLSRAAARSWIPLPFRVIELGGARIALKPSHVTLAKAAYHFATRGARSWGAGTVRAVEAQLRELPGAVVDPHFVGQLFSELRNIRWIDRRNGWFWFVDRPSSLVADARKLFSVSRRIAVRRFWAALFRPRPGPRPSLAALPAICAEISGARRAQDVVTVEAPLDRAAHLTEVELAMVEAIEGAGGNLPLADLEQLGPERGLSPDAVSRSLRRSPLFVVSPRRLVRLAVLEIAEPG